MITKICLICGKKFLTYPCRVRRGHGKYCSVVCADKAKRKVINRPSRDELVNLLDYYTFTELGKKYKVSRDVIKNWAKGYELDLDLYS